MFGLSTIATEAIAAAVVALLIFGGGMKLQYDIDAHRYDELKISYQQAQDKAKAEAAAVQKANDDKAIAAATAEATSQANLIASLQKELTSAKTHLSVTKITSTCVPYGFLRVMYAGSHGVTSDSISLPSGKSDDACSPLGWYDVATAILHDYGQSRANNEQLNALIDLLKKQGVTIK